MKAISKTKLNPVIDDSSALLTNAITVDTSQVTATPVDENFEIQTIEKDVGGKTVQQVLDEYKVSWDDLYKANLNLPYLTETIVTKGSVDFSLIHPTLTLPELPDIGVTYYGKNPDGNIWMKDMGRGGPFFTIQKNLNINDTLYVKKTGDFLKLIKKDTFNLLFENAYTDDVMSSSETTVITKSMAEYLEECYSSNTICGDSTEIPPDVSPLTSIDSMTKFTRYPDFKSSDFNILPDDFQKSIIEWENAMRAQPTTFVESNYWVMQINSGSNRTELKSLELGQVFAFTDAPGIGYKISLKLTGGMGWNDTIYITKPVALESVTVYGSCVINIPIKVRVDTNTSSGSSLSIRSGGSITPSRNLGTGTNPWSLNLLRSRNNNFNGYISTSYIIIYKHTTAVDAWYLPVFPEEFTDTNTASYNPTSILGRSVAYQTYNNTTRTFNVTLKLHEEICNDYTFVHRFAAMLQSICYPNYDGSVVAPNEILLVIGRQVAIRGVLTNVGESWRGPVIDDNLVYCDITLNITETTGPYSRQQVAARGSWRGRNLKDNKDDWSAGTNWTGGKAW